MPQTNERAFESYVETILLTQAGWKAGSVAEWDLFIQRMADNDEIVTRYMDNQEFQNIAFPILAREIFEAIRAKDVARP